MRFSRQREAVYNVLCCTDTHPDVSWIYQTVRQTMPNISLGTVYRNLQELCGLGKIKRVVGDDHVERFDANVSQHAHLHCTDCGAIVDIPMDSVSVSVNTPNVTRYEVTLYGICSKCQKNI